jgi:opacity protein-like surface antigen
MGLSGSRYTRSQAATDYCNEIFTLLALSAAAGSADYGEQSMKGTSFGILLLAFGATCASTRVVADDLLGFYVGAAVGESHVRTAKEILGDTDYDYEFDERHSAWKVTAGIRPISPLGVEVEYIDFGNPSAGNSTLVLGGLTQADAKASTLFGVGYLPLSVTFLDVYGKLGIARLHTTTTEMSPSPFCPAGFTVCRPTTFNISDWSTNFAYGGGIQGKIGSLAIRAEYERIGTSGASPDLISLGVTWTF